MIKGSRVWGSRFGFQGFMDVEVLVFVVWRFGLNFPGPHLQQSYIDNC